MVEQRKVYLDQMKGVAILLVVIGHVLLFSFGTSDNPVFHMLTIIHMPVFFYISGFLAYRSISSVQEWGKRLWKRTHALLFPYLAFAGLYCVFSGKNYLHLLSVGGSEYWFLYVLFLITVFFMVFELLVKNLNHPALYVAAWLIPYTFLIFVQYRFGEVGGGLFAINQWVAYYRFYLLGFLCRKYDRLNNFIFNNKYVYAIGLVAFFVRWFWGDGCNMIISFLGIMGAIIVLQHFFATSEHQESRPMRILAIIGQNTLEIYVLQYFFLPDLSHFITPYVNVSNGFIWQLLLALVLTIPITAVCYFIGTIIKKNSLLSWVLLGK